MANLLDQASIVLTPTAYDNGKVLCAKPSEPPYGDFDFSRNSAATRVNAQGLVENVQILSSNLVQNGDFSEEGVQEVSNGSFSQEGVQLVTNGDFATDTDWTLTQATISNGEATFATTDGSFAGIRQNVFTIGKTYLISLEVSNLIGTAEVNTNGGTSIGLDITSNGVKSFYMVAENTDIEIKRKFGITNVSATIDNVSVREVGQNWTLGTGWSIGEDKAVCDGTTANLIQSNVGGANKNFKLVFTISDYISGVVRPAFVGLNAESPDFSGNGTYTAYISSLTDLRLVFYSTLFNGSITNISVKEVGQNWDFTSTTTVGGGFANIFSDGSYQYIRQQNVLQIGRLYKLTYEITRNNGGSIKSTSFNTSTLVSDVGIHTLYRTASQARLFIERNQACDIDITNISVIEITDDTNLPRINYEGFSYQDALGSELVTNGDFDNGLNGWSSVNTTVVDGRAYVDASSDNNGYLKWNTALISGKFYKITFDLEIVQGSMNFENWGGSINKQYTGSQTITDTLVFEMDGSENKFLFGRNGIYSPRAIFYIDNVSVKEVTGQEVVPDSGCGSWLFEPQSTNLLPYSEDFSQWSSAGDVTIESGYLAPDGTNNAYKVSGTTSALTLSAGLTTTTTRSIYARTVSGTGQANLLTHNSNTNNLFTITEQWQRFDLNTANATGVNFFYAVDFRGSTNLSEIIIWGANATNDQDYATSYIPTEGSTVTRNQDVCTNGGSLASINSTEGTLYFEGSALANDGTTRIISLSDGTTANRVNLFFDTTNTLRAFITGVPSIATAAVITDNNKVALKFKSGDISVWLNGTEVATSTSTISLSGLSNLSFNQVGSSPFFGKTKALAVWKEALSDQELADLTYPTPTDPTFALDFDTIATDFTFARGSEATYVDAQGLIQSTATNTPRLDYSTGAEAFLLEPQSTNLVTYSEDFSQWDVINTPIITSNYGISPDGTQNADRLQMNTNDRIYTSVPASGNTAFSVYLKGSGIITLRDSTNVYRQDVTLTSEWERYSLYFNATSNNVQIQNQKVGDVDCEIWGAQVEQQSYPTSYIPTAGTTVTRNQETCINATPEINSEEGVLYFEGAILGNDGTYKIVSLSDGTTLNVVRFYYSITDNRIVGNVKSNSGIVFDFNHALQDSTDFLKIAISYRLNDFKMYVNGIKVASDTTGNTPIGLNILTFNNGGGTSSFFGNTKDVQVYTKALSDAELIKLTT